MSTKVSKVERTPLPDANFNPLWMPMRVSSEARTVLGGSYADAIFSPDGKTLYAVSSNAVTAIDVTSGKTLATYTLGTSLGGADISPDGRSLVVADEQGTSTAGGDTIASFYRIDLTTGAVGTYAVTSLFGFYDVAFLTDTTAIASRRGNFDLLTFNLTTGAVTEGLRAGNATLTPSADHSRLLVGHNDVQGTSTVLAADGSIVATYLLNQDPYVFVSYPSPDVGAQAIATDGSVLVPAHTFINPTQITDGSFQNARVPETYGANGFTFSADDETLFAATNNQVIAIDVTSGRAIGSYTLAAPVATAYDSISGTTIGYGDLVRASADGHYLSIITTAGLALIDLTTTAYNSSVGNDTLTGSGLLLGLDGNDILTSSGGSTVGTQMYGGRGDDTYYVTDNYSTVHENDGEGTDTVHAPKSYTLGDNIENLVLDGSQTIDGFGNALANQIVGNGAANSLYGYAGNDTVIGDGGNDTLDGGTGSDVMIGGAGDDSFVVDDAGDVVVENAGEGRDTVSSSISYTLPGNIEALVLTGTAAINGTGNGAGDTITGNGLTNILTGGAGVDTLDGGGGADVMIGNAGDDTFVVDNIGDIVVENPGQGGDTVRSSVSYTLSANVETLVLTGTAAIDGAGNDVGDMITGNAGSNTLSGGAGNDRLVGGGSDDVLIGYAGQNTLDGGEGIDTAVYDDFSGRYAIAVTGGNGTVSGRNGSDTLASVETLRFLDGTLTSDPNSAAAEVYRLYETALGRAPDQGGFDLWETRLADGDTLAAITGFFTASAEFNNRFAGTSNEQFVDQLYQTALHRDADVGGRDYYVGALNDGTATRDGLVLAFAQSDELRNDTASAVADGLWTQDEAKTAVSLLYDAELDRVPDSFGLASYAALLTQGFTLHDIANQIAGSAEFANRYGGLDDGAFVDKLYQTALDREPDAGGRAAYVDELQNGYSRGDLAYQFAVSGEHQNLLVAHNPSMFL